MLRQPALTKSTSQTGRGHIRNQVRASYGADPILKADLDIRFVTITSE